MMRRMNINRIFLGEVRRQLENLNILSQQAAEWQSSEQIKAKNANWRAI